MDIKLINDLINCLKRIIQESPTFHLPERGLYEKLELKSTEFQFIVDVNRKGRKKPKFSLQLRSKGNKDYTLLRLDILGPDHPNPEGDFPYSGEIIPCPHLHIAHPEYGDSIAYPLNNEYAKIYLTDEHLEDLVLILKEFLKLCNVGNIEDINYEYQAELI
ncbi:hypothetical protein M4D56_04185 [Cytobacillus oceanisediminis]|uniref:DUF6978 family protein n=1 Tax=Cytobacillus oceanisediminis TaxID=665099 RepID=UPI0018645B4D|nr:hypothetical protein [Cytobacillus oceanisediminis]MCM3528304.1 hypothetical protein [Cytobacillus oceanisediminis]QOK27644.1 hypothetical protein IIE26_02960 [Cytobacillus oceanisediminis]